MRWQEADSYVVGFNRDRDGYMVAAALAESGQLCRLVTDYYHGSGRISLPQLRHRSSPHISPQLVSVSHSALLVQAAWMASRNLVPNIGFPAPLVNGALAKRITHTVKVCHARRTLVYSGYAWHAFSRLDLDQKVLFQFHPAPTLIVDVMKKHAAGGLHFTSEPEIGERRQVGLRRRIEWEEATLILCASTFTKSSLIAEGVSPEKIAVVPYGCTQSSSDFGQTRAQGVSMRGSERGTRFLFVGQGIERKGLHHLLEAWRQIDSKGHTLRIVCSRLDSALRPMIADSKDVTFSGPISRDQLRQEMAMADCLVLPSLVEGFGLVLGEALAEGCTVIGTENTGLPDLRLPEPVAMVAQAGCINSLADKLKRMISSVAEDPELPISCRRYAEERSWTWFRRQLRDALSPEKLVDAESGEKERALPDSR